MQIVISVIVPAYNVAPFLGNCLDSILAQSFKELEIVIVDDGATDGSAQIADRYQARWPGKIRSIHTENHGVSSARLTGVRAAKGEWIGFVDGDDEIEPDMYERLYQNALQYQAEISHCGYRTIVNNGERVHEFYNTGRLEQQDTLGGLRELLFGSYEPTLCSKLFSKSLFIEMLHGNVMDLSICHNEDLLMNYYLFRRAERSVFEDFCAYHYLARKTSATRNKFQASKMLDPVKVRKQILDQIEPELEDLMWGNYLTLCNIALGSFAGQEGEEANAAMLRTVLLENQDRWHLMRRAERIKMLGQLYFPKAFRLFYQVYKKTLQKKRYE